VLAGALAAGVRLFQYRNKSGSRQEIYRASFELAGMVKRAGGIFIVNDHADIAKAVDADGVHLGQNDLPLAYGRKVLGRGKLIGISTHSVEQAREAEAAGADYIGFGPLFPTTTKDAGPCQGVEILRSLRKAVALPVLAIGRETAQVRTVRIPQCDAMAELGEVHGQRRAPGSRAEDRGRAARGRQRGSGAPATARAGGRWAPRHAAGDARSAGGAR